MRIAAKPVNTNSAPTTSASSGKTSGESFLEILMSGSGAQGAVTPSSHARGQSDRESSEGDAKGEQTQESSASPAQARTQAQSAANSTPVQSGVANAQQNQASNSLTPASAPAASNPDPALPANLDATLVVSENGDGVQAAQTLQPAGAAVQGKPAGAPQNSRSKSDAAAEAATNDQAQALAAVLIAVPVPVQQDFPQAVSSAGAVPALQAAASGTGDQATNPCAAQPMTNSKPQQTATSQNALDAAALALLNERSGTHETVAAGKDGLAAEQATGTDAAQNADSSTAPTSGERTAQSVQTSTYLTALLTPKADIASSTAQPPQGQAVNQFADQTSNALHMHSALSMGTTAGTTISVSSISGSPSAKGDGQNSDGSSANNTPSGSASTQHAQVPDMTAMVGTHSMDSALSQVLSATAAGNAHAISSSTTVGTSDAGAHRAVDAPVVSDGLSTVSSGSINTARLIQNMNESEMRVGMHSAEFGDISIRTMVSQQQVQAQISVNHSDLVNALSAHIPSVQAKMGDEYGLHAHIEVSQNGASFSNQSGQSSQQGQRSFVVATAIDGFATPAELDRLPMRAAAPVVLDSTRLDIQA